MIESLIQNTAATGAKKCFDLDISVEDFQIQDTRKEFDGEFTLVVFPLVKLARKSPIEIGQIMGDFLMNNLSEYLESYHVVQGFLNLKLKPSFWHNHLYNHALKPNFGTAPKASKGQMVVEYSSPNTNKPLHLGHLRNNFLGYSVAQILEAHGHTIAKVQIINDRGIHICKSMVSWKLFGAGETPETAGVKGDHLVGRYYVKFDQVYKSQIAEAIAGGSTQAEAEADAPIMVEARETLRLWEEGDRETYALWQRMNGWVYSGFSSTYQRMGVDFEKLYYESDTWLLGKDIVLKGLSDGHFYRKEDQSVWVDLTDLGLDEKLLLRKDGTTVYMTQDLGTAVLRFQDYPDMIGQVYTVGNEQEYHFKVLFAILKKLGHEWADNCMHLSYGMVELPDGKMKSREGTVVDADDLMEQMAQSAGAITAELGKVESLSDADRKILFEQIGMAALKYFLLKVDPKKSMLFNPEESIDFNGHTGPFIQYTYARISSILRQYGNSFEPIAAAFELNAWERNLQQKLYGYPATIALAASNYNPALLANYLFDLTKDFNSFYHHCSILQAENEASTRYRASLAKAVSQILSGGMALLGIQLPERM